MFRESNTRRFPVLLLHSLLGDLIRLRAPHTLQSTLEELHAQDGRAAGPENPREGGENGVGASSGAHGAPAKEELAEEGSEGDEAGEVEEGV
jgi:hypothetical protein